MNEKKKICIIIVILILISVASIFLIIHFDRNSKYNHIFDGYRTEGYDHEDGGYAFENGALMHRSEDLFKFADIKVDLDKKYIKFYYKDFKSDKSIISYYDDTLLLLKNPYEPCADMCNNIDYYVKTDDSENFYTIIYEKYYNNVLRDDLIGYYEGYDDKSNQADGGVVLISDEDCNHDNVKCYVEHGKYKNHRILYQFNLINNKDLELKISDYSGDTLLMDSKYRGKYTVYSLKDEYNELTKYGFAEHSIYYSFDEIGRLSSEFILINSNKNFKAYNDLFSSGSRITIRNKSN